MNLKTKDIKARQRFYGYSNLEMATRLHMSERTYNRRVANPDSLKVSEIKRLERTLKMEVFA